MHAPWFAVSNDTLLYWVNLQIVPCFYTCNGANSMHVACTCSISLFFNEIEMVAAMGVRQQGVLRRRSAGAGPGAHHHGRCRRTAQLWAGAAARLCFLCPTAHVSHAGQSCHLHLALKPILQPPSLAPFMLYWCWQSQAIACYACPAPQCTAHSVMCSECMRRRRSWRRWWMRRRPASTAT